MRPIVRICIIAAAFAGSAAAAQDAPPPADKSGAEIVVTGKRETERQLQEFVGALTHTKPNTPIIRFEWKACPAVAGLAPAQNAAVVARLRQVAKAAAVPLANDKCIPNVVVIATRDKKGMIEGLDRRYPNYFDGLPRHAVRRMARSAEPAAAWHIEGPPLDAEGTELTMERWGEKGLDTGGSWVNQTTRMPSRQTLAARSHYTAAVLVVEAKALAGLTATEFADYAAMRLFAETDPALLAPSAPPTILALLDAPMGTPVPMTLTRWDLSFLRALYAGNDTLYAPARRTAMRRQMARDLQPGTGSD